MYTRCNTCFRHGYKGFCNPCKPSSETSDSTAKEIHVAKYTFIQHLAQKLKVSRFLVLMSDRAQKAAGALSGPFQDGTKTPQGFHRDPDPIPRVSPIINKFPGGLPSLCTTRPLRSTLTPPRHHLTPIHKPQHPKYLTRLPKVP